MKRSWYTTLKVMIVITLIKKNSKIKKKNRYKFIGLKKMNLHINLFFSQIKKKYKYKFIDI